MLECAGFVNKLNLIVNDSSFGFGFDELRFWNDGSVTALKMNGNYVGSSVAEANCLGSDYLICSGRISVV